MKIITVTNQKEFDALPSSFFEFEHIETMEEVRKFIQDCEGKHKQQVAYSTYHDGLTQLCFECKKIRSTLPN